VLDSGRHAVAAFDVAADGSLAPTGVAGVLPANSVGIAVG
jgi:hypothetical protein